ncbi:AarF/ABC1/UbiB kinase family protein [Nocardioides marmoriginsengisoli]|uniref:AarF/ABC1/UbiB kinase family protein n=1 Tax=Nocardioides marmoriginsengisoli TaxID=661483 RepID=A0A3N0CC59_9ACTN|nr:AarF/ABC1/UbiB kinase family protein [Nocardioides marmoriginsengisoli]RNL61030.1 AarF/ABC1/UbiB kinase family protein [Nocardioides marmoriginsengisoli]
MTDLPRKAVARTARLAALPLGYAGRSAIGLGKRIGGAPAEVVMTELQQRTAEQLFKTLGELKGGAMKFGQAMSIFEAALPEELAAPYREQLTRLQDSAPPMPTITVRQILAEELGAEADRLSDLDAEPAAAASIGQVHRARWDGEEVAVKVQYPGAGDALRNDLKQLARVARGLGPVFPGIDVKPLVTELQERAEEELDYRLEAEAQRVFAAEYAGDPAIVVPEVRAGTEKVLVSSWLDSPASLAQVIREGTQAERDHYGERFVRFLFGAPARTGMLHADPHPGNFRLVPEPDGSPGRLGVLDYGAVARFEERALPASLGSLIRIACMDDYDSLVTALRDEGFIREKINVDAEKLRSYLGPFVEPASTPEFTFSRAWMQDQFKRVNDPKGDAYSVMLRLNLPPSYLLIHRTWVGGVGVLSQLGATVPFRQVLTESLPGFAG